MSDSFNVSNLDPVPALLSKIRAHLPEAMNAAAPLRLSRAPGRLDVMGGIAEYSGSLVCQLPLDCAVAAALQQRDDRLLHLVSFSQQERERPAAFRISLDELANHSADSLRSSFVDPQTKWAAGILGCLFVLHEQRLIDLHDPRTNGLSITVYNTVPAGAGLGSSAAMQAAAMMVLRDHFRLNERATETSTALNAMRLVEVCHSAQSRIVGSDSGITAYVTSSLGESGKLLRLICQPHELQPPLAIPNGMRFIGIDSGVRRDAVARQAFCRTRCATFMGHKIILDQMRQMGQAAGRQLIADPMSGYLANLNPDDYKRLFRPRIPQQMSGAEFVEKHGDLIDPHAPIDPTVVYEIQHATDHHVLEARRVRNFAGYLQQAAAAPGPRHKGSALDRAGHLMYASHLSYTMDAMLGSSQCDLLVQLARARERQGIYGARITAAGGGGTVAILADCSAASDEAIAQIMEEYQKQTGHTPRAFTSSSPGARHIDQSTESHLIFPPAAT
jgi:galactokinase